jgi:hypothetical protein
MKTQNLIKRRLSQPESVVVIQQILEHNREAPRTTIAERVCERFEFFDALGKPQKIGCLDALRELEQAGLREPVEAPQEIPAAAGQIDQLELIRVQSETHVRIRNELIMQEHSRGAGPLVGAQVRYLIGSAHGWLGALGFSASALHWHLIVRREVNVRDEIKYSLSNAPEHTSVLRLTQMQGQRYWVERVDGGS